MALAVNQPLVDELIDQIVTPIRTVGLLANLLNGDSGGGSDGGEDLLSAIHSGGRSQCRLQGRRARTSEKCQSEWIVGVVSRVHRLALRN